MNKKKYIKNIILLLSSTIIFGGIFIAYEFNQREKYRLKSELDIDIWRAVVYSNLIYRRSDTELAFRFYGLDAEEIYAANIRLNNLGLISKRDYTKEKNPNEFRIIILGGEQSASTVANISWPDVLEDELNKRHRFKNFKVLNFAWPDAGPEHYINYWRNEASKYSPDLVIVNSPETDFYRTLQGANLTVAGKELNLSQDYKFQIDDEWFLMKVAVTKDNKEPISLENKNVIASRPYGIFPYNTKSPINVASDKKIIKKVLSKLVNDQINASMPVFGAFTLHKLGLYKGNILEVSQIRNFDILKSSNNSENITVDFGIKNFSWMKNNIPNVVFIHNFHAGEMNVNFKITQKINEIEPSIKIIDMRKYVPSYLSKEEINTWYLIPHMGEKFSDKGHRAYAGLVADMLCETRKIPAKDCDGKNK